MNTTIFTDSGLNPTTTYYYRLTAVNTGGSSAPTAVVSAKTQVDPAVTPPVTPTGFIAAAQSNSDIQLTWTDNPDETSYLLERQVVGQMTWTLVATLPQDSTGYLDSGLTSATAYMYRLTAVNFGGNSAPATAGDMTF
jgi:hypothetical protein